MTSFTKRIALAAVGLVGLLALATPQAANASPVSEPKLDVCGFYKVSYDGYWHNCNTIPERIHVYRYGGNDFEICVDANQTRYLGWVGGDWGGVLGAVQIGRCPG